MDKMVEARTLFYEHLPEELKGAIEPYDPERYATAASLHGQRAVRPHRPQHAGRAGAHPHHRLPDPRRLGLFYDDVLASASSFNVGAGGRRLTAAQRQKLDVARALLKRADYLIFNRPMGARPAAAGPDPAQRARRSPPGRPQAGHHLGADQPGMAQYFNRVVVFDGGDTVEDGSHETLWEETVFSKAMLA